MDSKQLTKRLKIRARELGFHAVGITPAEPLAQAARALLERMPKALKSAYDDTPDTTDHFTNPAEALFGAKSVVVVALSYFTEEVGKNSNFARFARGEDYHKVVSRRLQELADWLIEVVPQARTFVSVDTGPFLEKVLARQAGVGSYGKNTLIYVEGYGSWVVLGEMLTDVCLEPDQPEDSDHCGDCEVCIKSCPTGAIRAPYVINANRCISHFTQMKGYIPRDLRPLIGDTIYGCDICQNVCPRNHDAAETDAAEFFRTNQSPALAELLNVTPEEFRRGIQHTAAGWIKRTRFRRNVAVALGNIKDPEAVPGLITALGDQKSVIRAHAAWALGQIATPAAVEALCLARPKEHDLSVKDEIDAALSGLPMR